MIVAFDLSLTRTGWASFALSRPESAVMGIASYGTIAPAGTGMPRLNEVRRRVLERALDAELVLLEGYSFGSRQSHAHALGELGGVVRLALWEARYTVVDVPPACLKKYATGRGNAKKAEVLAAAIRRLNYQGADDNEADALWMVQMGLAWQGRPEAASVPVAHREGLVKVRWPTVGLQSPESAG